MTHFQGYGQFRTDPTYKEWKPNKSNLELTRLYIARILPTRNGNSATIKSTRSLNSGSTDPTYKEWKQPYYGWSAYGASVYARILPTRNGNLTHINAGMCYK